MRPIEPTLHRHEDTVAARLGGACLRDRPVAGRGGRADAADAVQPRRPGLGRRRAGAGHAARARRSRSTASGVTRRFAMRADGRYLGLVEGLRARRERADRRAAAAAARGWCSSTTRSAGRSSPARRSSRGRASTARWTRSATARRATPAPTSPSSAAPLRAYDADGSRRRRRRDHDDRPGQGRCRSSCARRPACIDRDEYRVAALYDPTQPWEPYAPQDQFNHKLVITHGASCDTDYEQAEAPDVLQRDGARQGLRRDVPRARQRRPQLQHRHAGRVAR